MSTGKFDAFAGIEPDREKSTAGRPAMKDLDRSADRMGFTSRREPEVAIKRQRGTDDAVHQFTMRVRVRASNKFVAWCEEERLSYREGFDKLVEFIDRIKPR